MNPKQTTMCLLHVAMSLKGSSSRRVLRLVADIQDAITQTLSEHELKHMSEQKDAMLNYVVDAKPSTRKRLSIKSVKPINSGFNGLLFSSTNPNLVVKASMDQDEYRIATKLIKQHFEHIAAVIHAEERELKDGRSVYFLMMEKLFPLEQKQHDVLERVLDPIWEKLDRRNLSAVESAIRTERDTSYGYMKSTLSEVLEICAELKEARLWHTDLHSRNIMADSDGVLKIVDLAAIRNY
jgi:thiamine kinase-like enzyme